MISHAKGGGRICHLLGKLSEISLFRKRLSSVKEREEGVREEGQSAVRERVGWKKEVD